MAHFFREALFLHNYTDLTHEHLKIFIFQIYIWHSNFGVIRLSLPSFIAKYRLTVTALFRIWSTSELC